MFAPLAKLMDWSAIQIVATMTPADGFNNPRLTEALRFLKGPDFIPTESQPAEVEFSGSLHFRFPTPRPCDCTENNVVHGRLYRCRERWQERPVIILMPGWGDFASYNLRFPLLAQLCNRAEFNVATLEPPYHFQRRPRRRGMFDSGNLLLMAQSTAQAIAEIRGMVGWLLREGCPAVTLWGYSLGAWYAGMAACCDARLSAVVLVSPCVRMNPWVQQRAIRPRIRAQLQRVRELCDALNGTALNLTSSLPVIPKEKALLIEAIHDDAICPKDDTEHLWQSWGQPDIWRLPHGHVGVCCGFVPGLPKRILCWLKPRLNAPDVQARLTEATEEMPSYE